MGRDFSYAGSALFLVTAFLWAFPNALPVWAALTLGALTIIGILAIVPKYWSTIADFYGSRLKR
jgi:hypothetical protein